MKRSRQHRFFRSQEGTAAIEFALISPVVLLLIMGTIEMSVMMLAQNVIESATFIASRTSKTGFVAEGQTRENTILREINNIAGVMLNTDNVIITRTAYDEFGDIGQPEPFIDANDNKKHDEGENYTDVNGNNRYDTDMGTAGSGTAGEVVVYTVTYPWHFATPLVGTILGNEHGILNLVARTVVRNEPF